MYPLLPTSTSKPTFPYLSLMRHLNRISSGQARRPHIVSISFPPQPKFLTLMYALLARIAHGEPFGCARTVPSHPVEMQLHSCPILNSGLKESATIQYRFRLHAKAQVVQKLFRHLYVGPLGSPGSSRSACDRRSCRLLAEIAHKGSERFPRSSCSSNVFDTHGVLAAL